MMPWCFYRCWEQLLGFREIGYSWYVIVTLFSVIAPLLIVDHSSQQILIIKCDSEADVRRHHQWIFLEPVTVVTSAGSRAVHGYVFCCFSEFRGLVFLLSSSPVSPVPVRCWARDNNIRLIMNDLNSNWNIESLKLLQTGDESSGIVDFIFMYLELKRSVSIYLNPSLVM